MVAKKKAKSRVNDVSHLQREVYWIVLLVMFFIEREAIIEMFLLSLRLIIQFTQ
jgi:hypothetical protein